MNERIIYWKDLTDEWAEKMLTDIECRLDSSPRLGRWYETWVIGRLGMTRPLAILASVAAAAAAAVAATAVLCAVLLSSCGHSHEPWGSEPDAVTQADSSGHAEAHGMADYEHGMRCMEHDSLRAAEYYLRRAVEGSGQELLRHHPDEYFAAVTNLTQMLIDRSENEHALRLADHALKQLDSQPRRLQLYYRPAQLSSIGHCQLRLGHREAGLATLTECLEQARQYARSDTTVATSRYMAIVALSVAQSVAEQDTLCDEHWIVQAEQAVAGYAARVDSSDQDADALRGAETSLRATWLAHRGQFDEAREVFRQHRDTRYSRTEAARIEQINYYKAARRWDKAVRMEETVLKQYRDRGMRLTLDYLSLLADAARIYRITGRPDDAVKATDEVMTLIDSVRRHEQENDAQELAVIYETRQKEQQIYQQQWQMRRQQGAAVAVILALMLAVAVAYALLRRRSSRRLEAANRRLADSNRQLALARDKAEEASRMKTKFIQQINHEIRTPLNAIVGFSQIVTDLSIEVTEEELADMNRRIAQNAELITSHVNKMIELSDAISQTSIRRTDRVSPATLASDAEEQSHIRQAAHLQYHYSADADADALTITTHRQLAARALALLLDNARKFTQNTPAAAKATVPGASPSGNTAPAAVVDLSIKRVSDIIVFTMQDTGCGIPPDEAEHIFQEFVKLDEFRTGLGIGLTVARHIARQLGGDIRLDTTYTHGARFQMTLPLSDPQPPFTPHEL